MANKLIISPYALSFEDIKNALQSYIQSTSSLPKSWSDFYTAGAGQTILELDAAVAAFLAFHIILSRRESLLTTAQNYESIVGLGSSLGYNASRGHNLYLDLSLVPATTLKLPKWTIVGQYDIYDLVLLEDTIFEAGQRMIVPVVVGNAEAQQIPVVSDTLQQFTFTSDKVTDDFRLLLNDTELPTHKTLPSGDKVVAELKDAVNDYYITLTNPYGAVDVFYLNTSDSAQYKYQAGDTLYLHYIARNNVQYKNLSPDAVTVYNADGDAGIEVFLHSNPTDQESSEHIKICAPIYHETNNVVRARKDYVKLLKENDKTLIDANDRDINPGLIALTYLKSISDDGQVVLMTDEEKSNYAKFMSTICPDGVATAIIQDPVKVLRTLDITYKIKNGEYLSPTFALDIDNILEKYRNKLGPSFNLDDIEHEIERLPGIKTARVTLGNTNYQTNTRYKLYDVIEVKDVRVGNDYEDWTFYCSHVQPLTGESTPDWSSAQNEGNRVVDNNFIWENSDKFADSISARWTQNGKYEIFSNIKADYTIPASCTSSTQPRWGEVTQIDGNITWNKIKSYPEKIEDYLPLHEYSLNQSAAITYEDEESPRKALYKVTSITHKSGNTAPNWLSLLEVGDQIIDNAITWKLVYKGWKANNKYISGDEVGVIINDKLRIYRAMSDGVSKNTCTLNGDSTVYEIVTNPNTGLTTTIIWILQDEEYEVSDWQANQEYDIDTYIQAIGNFYQAIDNSHITSGTNSVFYNGSNWLETVEDNNVVWTLLDKGRPWLPSHEYRVDDYIIVMSTATTYIYQCQFVVDTPSEKQNIIYSVVTYAGTTSDTEPEWKDESGEYKTNVYDNDILWTQVSNRTTDIEWSPGVIKYIGDVIKVDGMYYTFTSIIGLSGNTVPNWAGITNNIVVDNNITWTKINELSSINLMWNEYLDLTYNLKLVD